MLETAVAELMEKSCWTGYPYIRPADKFWEAQRDMIFIVGPCERGCLSGNLRKWEQEEQHRERLIAMSSTERRRDAVLWESRKT